MSFPIIILHGWGRGQQSFEKLKKLLEEKGHQVYSFDLPGFGEEKEPDQPWSVSNYADYVLNFSQTKDLNKFFLFGHSFGGRVGIKFASHYPEKLAGLILCDSAGVTPRNKVQFGFLAKSVKIGKKIFSLPVIKYFYPFIKKVIYFLTGNRDYYRLQSEIMRETFKKVIAEDLKPYLSDIKIPTLIVWGEKDKATPVSDAKIINEKISNSQLKIFKNIGHNPQLEMPEKLAGVINDFIKNI